MKKIGEGYYYYVYKLNEYMVLKKVKNRIRIFVFIIFANKFRLKNTLQEYKNVIKALPKLKIDYGIILEKVADKNLLGNPIFVNNLNYKQDMALSLHNINNFKKDEFIKIIEDYVVLLKQLWQFGIHDSVFNFSINCGYNKEEQLFLLDFNEVSFNKEIVKKQIIEQIWLQRASYLNLTKENQTIFSAIMSDKINQAELERNWLARNLSKCVIVETN